MKQEKTRQIICPRCNQTKQHKAKGMCYNCYKKYGWQKKKVMCRRCGKDKHHHARGYCGSCHTILFAYDRVKRNNVLKYHKISLELYRQITKECVLCGFSKVVNLHHKDENHQNNNPSNLVGLCPDHHMMYHKHKYKEGVVQELQKKGYQPDCTVYFV